MLPSGVTIHFSSTGRSSHAFSMSGPWLAIRSLRGINTPCPPYFIWSAGLNWPSKKISGKVPLASSRFCFSRRASPGTTVRSNLTLNFSCR